MGWSRLIVGSAIAEGEGLEPPSPFGQRFSRPSAASSRNVANLPGNPLLAEGTPNSWLQAAITARLVLEENDSRGAEE